MIPLEKFTAILEKILLETFCESAIILKNIVKERTYFKNLSNASFIDLDLTSKIRHFQHSS